ncbi:transglycosylase domain-containing protein [Corynebacterium sp. H78]|uniref:transglycosylase domain-containing protein n=1 Tax=Corynebacterium sp. H78 TaxID=3133417 RepID=UPI0030B6B576
MRVNNGKNLLKLAVAVILTGLVLASALFPPAGGVSYLMARTADDLAVSARSVITEPAPSITTITDRNGEPMAWMYEQRRVNVPSEKISEPMKQAIVAIEDRRFWEHSGVDWQGTARAAVTNFVSGSVAQGASTLEQQLIKNHTLLVNSKTEAERRAATATDYGRKLREIRIAQDLEGSMSKDEVLTKYLNVVPFGNGSFGVEVAAQTYFGVPAAELKVEQAALLAGLVQQTTGLDPYTNPEGATARRNEVLSAMESTGAITPEQAKAAKDAPLGVLEEPQSLPQGCISAGDRGFFCDYTVSYLNEHGIDREELARGGYTIRTTLDPKVQENTQRALREQADPQAEGVAEVMNVVEPGKDTRRVLAMASSRVYGLDANAKQTVQPQTYTPVGNGAGSVFKIFAATAAVERGMGIDSSLWVPRRYEAWGLGSGGAAGCPEGMYCVENVGNFPSSMTLRESLARSPNTPFIQMSEQVGVDGVMDMAVRLGMRSYTEEGSFDGESSVQEYVSENTLGSFVLGPTPVDALELSNVGATLASGGRWCEPSPIDSITDSNGEPVELEVPPCEDAVDPGVAGAIANAMSEDTTFGTAKDAAAKFNWDGKVSAKTGTTESHQSAAFLGFTNGLAAAVYTYNDSPTVTQLCTTPLRQCWEGDLFGGREPARTWFSAMRPIVDEYGGMNIPELNDDFLQGTSISRLPNVVGMQEPEARRKLEEAGFKVESQRASQTGEPRGIVTSTQVPGLLLKGGTVTIYVSDGSAKPAPPRTTTRRPTSTWTVPSPSEMPSLEELIPDLPTPPTTGGGGGGGGGGTGGGIDIPGIGRIPF